MALDMQNYVRRVQTRDGAPSFNFTLSPAVLAVICLAMVLILGWCFYMGFMVGRGQNPEEHMQRIAAMLRSDEAQQQSVPASPQPGDQALVAQNQAAQPETQAQAQGQPMPQAGVVPGYPSFQASSPAPAAGQAVQAPSAQTQPAKQKKEQAKNENAPFTFVYRMATVKTRDAARGEQARYENKGFRTSIRSFGKGWSLFYTFKGTDKDCEQFLNSVKKAGLGTPARVSKKKN